MTERTLRFNDEAGLEFYLRRISERPRWTKKLIKFGLLPTEKLHVSFDPYQGNDLAKEKLSRDDYIAFMSLLHKYPKQWILSKSGMIYTLSDRPDKMKQRWSDFCQSLSDCFPQQELNVPVKSFFNQEESYEDHYPHETVAHYVSPYCGVRDVCINLLEDTMQYRNKSVSKEIASVEENPMTTDE